MPATRLRSRRPGEKSSAPRSATAGSSGTTGSGAAEEPGGRPRDGLVKRGEPGPSDIDCGSASRGYGGCRDCSQTAERPAAQVGARRRPRGEPHSGAGAHRQAGGRRIRTGCRPWLILRKCHRILAKCTPKWHFQRQADWQGENQRLERERAFSRAREKRCKPRAAAAACHEKWSQATPSRDNAMTARAPKTQKSCDFLSADPGNCHRIRFRGNRRCDLLR